MCTVVGRSEIGVWLADNNHSCRLHAGVSPTKPDEWFPGNAAASAKSGNIDPDVLRMPTCGWVDVSAPAELSPSTVGWWWSFCIPASADNPSNSKRKAVVAVLPRMMREARLLPVAERVTAAPRGRGLGSNETNLALTWQRKLALATSASYSPSW